MNNQCFLRFFIPRSQCPLQRCEASLGFCLRSKLRHRAVKCVAVVMWEGNSKAEHRHQVPKLLSQAEIFPQFKHVRYLTHCQLS